MAFFDSLRGRAYSLLRSSERYTKTDMVYLSSGSFWLFFSQGVTVLLSFVLAVAFANLLEPEKFGNYKYILSLAGIIGAFTLTGLGTAVTRASARGHDGTFLYAFRKSLVWSVGMLVIAGVGGIYYFIQDNVFLGTSLFIIGATAPVISAASLYRPFLMGKKQFRVASLLGVVQGAIPTLSVLGALLLGAPLIILVATYFVSNIATFWILYKQSKQYIENESVDPATNHIGKHLSIMGVVSTIAGKLDSVLVFQLLGGTELAIFALATSLPDTIRGSFKNFDALAMPKFAKKTKSEMKRAVWSKTVAFFALTVIVAVAYILLAPFLFKTFFSQYLEAIVFTQVYVLIIPLSFVLASSYFDSQAAVKERYILSITNNILKIATTVAGIFFFGIWGAIAARLLTRFVNVLLSAFFIAKH